MLARRRVGCLAVSSRNVLCAALLGAVLGGAFAWQIGVSSRAALSITLVGTAATTLLTIASISLWNEVVLPAWLFSRTEHPLAKTAFGLGLVLVALFFYFPAMLLLPSAIDLPQSAQWFIDAVQTVACAAVCVGLVGKLFCLAAAFCASAQGPLMWSTICDLILLAIIVGQNRDPNAGASRLRLAPWLSLLSAVLFVVALKRVASELNESRSRQRAQMLLLWLVVVCPTLFIGNLVGSFTWHWMDIAFGTFFGLAWLVGLIRFARLVGELQERALQRI